MESETSSEIFAIFSKPKKAKKIIAIEFTEPSKSKEEKFKTLEKSAEGEINTANATRIRPNTEIIEQRSLNEAEREIPKKLKKPIKTIKTKATNSGDPPKREVK